jgi:RHS repeat-associated protein
MYTAWGEAMYEYTAQSTTGSFDSPYRFNGKELDKETGYGYYGARYYQSKLSMWLSVDPLAHKYPNMSPYAFTGNNPVMLVDPDGREIYEVAEDGSINKVAETRFARDQNGNVRELPKGEEKGQNEEYVNRFIGKDRDGKDIQADLDVDLQINQKEVDIEGLPGGQIYSQLSAGSHEDAKNFMMFTAKSTSAEFAYAFTKAGPKETFRIGTLHTSKYSMVYNGPGDLIYHLHTQISESGPSPRDGDAARNNPKAFYEVLENGRSWTQYGPNSIPGTKPPSMPRKPFSSFVR